MRPLILILFNTFLLTVGQILWKIGLNKIGVISLDNIRSTIFSPFIVAGLLVYVLATAIWFIVISKTDLSYAYPLQSLAYVFGVIAAWLIFKENIPFSRWAGVSIIIAGVALVSYK